MWPPFRSLILTLISGNFLVDAASPTTKSEPSLSAYGPPSNTHHPHKPNPDSMCGKACYGKTAYGTSYKVECNATWISNVATPLNATSYADCADKCTATGYCTGFSFVHNNTKADNCWFANMGPDEGATPPPDLSGTINSGTFDPASVQCSNFGPPGHRGYCKRKQVSVPDYYVGVLPFDVHCGVTYQGIVNTSAPGSIYYAETSGASTYLDCSQQCADNKYCLVFSYSVKESLAGQNCYALLSYQQGLNGLTPKKSAEVDSGIPRY